MPQKLPLDCHLQLQIIVCSTQQHLYLTKFLSSILLNPKTPNSNSTTKMRMSIIAAVLASLAPAVSAVRTPHSLCNYVSI